MLKSEKSKEKETPYRNQVWKYLVYEMRHGKFQIAVDGQTDSEAQAVDMVMGASCPAYVKDVLRDEVIYRNY